MDFQWICPKGLLMVYTVQTETGCAVDYLILAVCRAAFRVKQHRTPAQKVKVHFFVYTFIY